MHQMMDIYSCISITIPECYALSQDDSMSIFSSIFPGRTVSYWTPFLWHAHDHNNYRDLLLMTDEEWWMAYMQYFG